MAKRARVIRDVLIRGAAHAVGAVGSISHKGEKQPGDAFVISDQEFHEMRTANYVVEHVDAPVAAPVDVAPVAQEPVAEAPAEATTKKGSK